MTDFITAFENAVKTHPDKPALACGGAQLSYTDLRDKAGRIAQKLIDSGVEPGDSVVVQLPRGIDAVCAVMGVMLAGAAVCVLSSRYPRERIRMIRRELKVHTTISQSFLDELPEDALTAARPHDAQAPAVIVYTSGSSGRPKGVINPWATFELAVRGFAEERTADDVLLSAAEFSFIAGLLEIAVGLYLGAAICIAPDEVRRDGMRLSQFINEAGVTSAFLPPEMARFVLPRTQQQLRTLFTGSDIVRGLWSREVKVYNTYGASETCGPVTRFRIDRPYGHMTPVGRPFEGSHIYILSDDMHEAAPGEDGEICVSGQIALRYVDDPSLTSKQFIEWPGAPGERIYRTGDRGHITAQGNLVFTGRMARMIKLRGYRIEPAEIEAAIIEHGGASQAAVVAFENAAGHTALYGAYTASKELPAAQVREAIAEILPDYMIPAFLEQCSELPLTDSGKIAWNALEVPRDMRFRAPYEAPATPAEKRIAAAFEKVLHQEKVGADDDFNLLGGDSVRATELAAELADLGLSVADILSAATPRALAAMHVDVLPKAADREVWPLTFAERQMAAEQGMHPQSIEYNLNSQGLRIRGPLDIDRLQQALDAMMVRHGVLRSRYPMEHGQYVHRLDANTHVDIERIACAPDETIARADEINVPFSLSTDPLMRVHLFEHGTDDNTLHFTFHHIIMDGTSWNTFISELFALYDGRILPDQERTYLDHAVWQRDSEDLAPGEQYFTEVFPEGVPETEMPTHPIRPDVLPPADRHLEERIPLVPLQETAEKLGVTKYEVLMTALGMTLAKYTGGEDVVIGTAMSGRTKKEQAGMIGMFVNTVPVHLHPRGEATLQETALETACAVRGAKDHQTLPFERLVSMLAPDRTSSRGPVFDVMFNYLQKEAVPQAEGLQFAPVEFGRQELAVDIGIEALVQENDIRLVVSYSDKLYDPAVVRNFVDQFLTLLHRMETANGSELVMDIGELPDEQRRQILADFAGEKTDGNRGRTIVELFREQAEKTPHNTAAVYEGEELTYAQLDDITDRLAARLAQMGLARGKVAGIMVERGLMMPIGALGVLKTGAAYLPMDPEYPAERLEYMLGDAGVELIVADENLTGSVPGYKGKWLFTKDVMDLPEAGELPEGPQPEDLLILLYTSGTTGNPKGVMLLHRNLASFVDYYRRTYDLGPEDRVAAYASFGFDAAMMDMYPTLTSGAAVYIIPESMRLDLPGMRRYFEENGITVGFMTTQLGRQFAENDAPPPFRALSTGGETLTPIAPPNFGLYNVYGPTETTIFVTRYPVDTLYDRVPIGRAVDNMALYVVDGHGRLAPVGVAGELGIAGRQVAAGYLNREDLTAEKFVQNPFTDDPDYRKMYRSGDVVRFLPTGDIDFVGRRDFQVKIRGFRVELTEIEGRIRQYPGIRDAAVVALDDAGGGKRIAAYIVADNPVDIHALNAFIEEELPSYMVPAATMQLDRIPLNQNGKVDRRRLPKIQIQADELVAPVTDLEKKLHEIVAGILGHTEFGTTTDLLYAGLNSLSSIKAAALITERTGRELSTTDLMRDKTIGKIARRLEKADTYEHKTYETRSEYPLTQNQLGLYFAVVKDPGTLVYNIPFVLELPAGTDTKKLADSLRTVFDAHPYIKTHLTLSGNEPRQVRCDDAPVEISITDGTEEEARERRVSFVRPFNFFEGPLYHAEIFRTPQHVYLFLDFHHMIFDGGSMDIFLRDLADAFEGRDVAPEEFTSFDLALENSERMADGAADRAKEWFAALLADGEGATKIPADKPGSGGSPKTVSAQVPKARICDALRGLGVTPANLFLAATALVTQRFAGTREVRIASITNGRDGVRVQNNIGMLVETMPAIIDPAPDDTAKTYVSAVQQRMMETMEHKAYPYLYAASDFGYDAQILYAFQGGVVSERTMGGSAVVPQILGIDRAKFPISVNIQEDADSYIVEAEYDDAVFSKAAIEAFADCTAHMAQVLVLRQDKLLKNMSIQTDQQAALIESFNEPPVPVKGSSLNGYFEAWAEKTPDATALIARGAALTYAQLNAQANRLAHALIAKGAERGDRIAFMLPRTKNILVAMLGIMKTGAAYIPIDPEYPAERIRHILGDSGARFLLVQDDTTGAPDEAQSEILSADALLASSADAANPNVPVHPDDLCYLIYTSGSTGKPKGVMIEHRNIMNYVTNVPQNIPDWALTSRGCSMVSVTTVSFDMFLKEAFTTLMNGRCLILADDEEAKNPDQLARLFEKTGGNAFNATPSRMLQYMELPAIRRALRGCRVIMAGGEAYPPVLYQKLRSITEAELINTYGPTEITVSCNAKILTDDNISVGRPLYGVIEQIMDMYGNPLPAGVTGELWIGGNGVGRGYWGNERLTREQFVEWNGSRWYKSGDLARWTDSGDVRILGRSDGQIKLRGLRIELGEIEKALAAIPGITSSVVLVRRLHGQEHLCAYYTAKREIAPQDVRSELAKSLTQYMVPTAYLQLPSLPMTPNGKIDRKALPDAALMRREEYVEPATDAEQAYAEIFSKILQLEKVGATDNFFDMGGTSLLVTQLTIDAADRGLHISYGDVFANPTPRGLAALGETERTPVSDEEISSYDYTKLHRLLEENTIDALVSGEMRDLGNVCISGATGFLGIHVLREYLRTEKGTAYCIVRAGKSSDAATRLRSLLVYYFSDSFDELFGSRIIVVEGDVTDEKVYEKLAKYPIDTFINCAANVKHFSAGTDIEDVNVGGVKKALAFCAQKGCRFIQISTASTAGMRVDGAPEKSAALTEQMLYFGQDLANKYTHSKFLAERLTLEAAAEGLDAKIMRVGNLMAREEDGEFQANFRTNNFLGRLKAYSLVGRIPYEALGMNTEFAPIDYTARAILALAGTPRENRVFHPYNDHSVYYADVVEALRKMGIRIEPSELAAYEKAVSDAMRDPRKAQHLNSLIAYQESGHNVEPIQARNAFTQQVLLRLGFLWPITTPGYLDSFFRMMEGLGYFDETQEEDGDV